MKKPMRVRRFMCWLLGHRATPAKIEFYYNQGANSNKLKRAWVRDYCHRCEQEASRIY